MAVTKEADKDTGGDINNPGIDNPGYSKGDSQDKDAFKDKNNIWNNQTIDQEAPKVTKDEAEYGDAPFIKSDDAKALSDIIDKFAPNADKPTTASANQGKNLPEILQQVDPKSLAQMLPQMMKSMGQARDVMNITIPSARITVIRDSFSNALTILNDQNGYETVITAFSIALAGNGYASIVPQFAGIVSDAILNLVKNAFAYGADNIPKPIYNQVVVGTLEPNPVVLPADVPLLYVKQYYPITADPYPGYIQWLSPDGTKSVYVKRGPTDYPTDSALQDLFTSAEINLAKNLNPYIATQTLTVDILNNLLIQQDQLTYDQGINNSLGNGSGGGGGGQGMQQLLGILMQLIQKFQNGQLKEGVLNQGNMQKTLEKFKNNMGALNKLDQLTGKAFGLGNIGDIGNLQGMLSQAQGMLGKGGGGGGGGSGGGGGGGGGSSPSAPFTQNQIKVTNNILNILANNQPKTV